VPVTDPLRVSELAKGHWLITNSEEADVRQVIVSPDRVVLRLRGRPTSLHFRSPGELAAHIHMLMSASQKFNDAYYCDKITRVMEGRDDASRDPA
jgi:hypothetical protein